MKLYQHPFSPNCSPNCQKVTARRSSPSPTRWACPSSSSRWSSSGARREPPAMLAKNPNGKVPTLEDDDLVLWESSELPRGLLRQRPGGDPRGNAG